MLWSSLGSGQEAGQRGLSASWLADYSVFVRLVDDAIDNGGQKKDGKHNLSNKEHKPPNISRVIVRADCCSIANTVIKSLSPNFDALKMVFKKQRKNSIGDDYMKIPDEYKYKASARTYRVPRTEDELSKPNLEYLK